MSDKDFGSNRQGDLPTETVIAAIAKDRADWLVDAVACATQDRRFLRGDPQEDEYLTEVLFLNAEKAIRAAILKAATASAVGTEAIAGVNQEILEEKPE